MKQDSGDGKKRKVATPQNASVFWTQDVIDEWNKYAGYDSQWAEGGWVTDWSDPKEAWDRYAVLDGQCSKYQLEEGNGDTRKKPKKEVAKPTGEDKSIVGPVDEAQAENTEEGKEEEKEKEEVKAEENQEEEAEESEDELEDLEELAADEKLQTKLIAKYLREIKSAGWKITKHEQLTDEIKLQFKKPFLPTAECRPNVYWKRPSCGVHLKSEKKDICTFAVDPDCGSYLLRLHASLKAAGLLATRTKSKPYIDNISGQPKRAKYTIKITKITLWYLMGLKFNSCNTCTR